MGMSQAEMEKMYNENESLVSFVLIKHFTTYMNHSNSELEDMYQEGRMALWEAVQKFDESKGYKFSSFACRYIFGRVKSFISTRYGMNIKSRSSKSRNYDTHIDVLSYDFDIEEDDGHFITAINTFADPEDKYAIIFDDYEDHMEMLKEAFAKASRVYGLKLFEYLKDGEYHSRRDTEAALGISRTTVTNIVRKAEKIYREELANE